MRGGLFLELSFEGDMLKRREGFRLPECKGRCLNQPGENCRGGRLGRFRRHEELPQLGPGVRPGQKRRTLLE